MKPTRCTLLLGIFISTSLHVSGNCVPIIRRTYCIYAILVFFTLYGWLSGLLVGTRWVAVWSAGWDEMSGCLLCWFGVRWVAFWCAGWDEMGGCLVCWLGWDEWLSGVLVGMRWVAVWCAGWDETSLIPTSIDEERFTHLPSVNTDTQNLLSQISNKRMTKALHSSYRSKGLPGLETF